MARERSNQVCAILDNVIIDKLNDEVERLNSSKSKVVAQWINSYFNVECALKDYEASITKMQQEIQVLQQEKDMLKRNIQNRDRQLLELDNQRGELEKLEKVKLDYEASITKMQQEIQVLQQEKDMLKRDIQNRDKQLLGLDNQRGELEKVKLALDNQRGELEKVKLELQNNEKRLQNIKIKRREVSRLQQAHIERLQIELKTKDNEIKRIAAPLERLLTAGTKKNKIKKWWQFWKRQETGSQK